MFLYAVRVSVAAEISWGVPDALRFAFAPDSRRHDGQRVRAACRRAQQTRGKKASCRRDRDRERASTAYDCNKARSKKTSGGRHRDAE
jgi:hypothetical protein